MGLYIGGGLPGPFSWSMRVPPRVRPPRRRPVSRSSSSCPHSRPAARPANPRPQDRTITNEGSMAAGIFWTLMIFALVVLAILGFAGFKL